MRFRTETGSLYEFYEGHLIRLNEAPVLNQETGQWDDRPIRHEVRRVIAMPVVGDRAIFDLYLPDEDRVMPLKTSRVTVIL